MRILIIEDNADLADSVAESMRQMGHAVDIASDGARGDMMLKAAPYDLAVLDLNLPPRDGFADGLDVLRSCRRRAQDTLILILTARADTRDRVEGLNLGADDYLTKPFYLQEFDARVRALLRRRQAAGSPIIRAGQLEFDTNSRMVTSRGRELRLTRRERGLLEILLSAHSKVIPKDKIAERLFSYDDEAGVAAVELYVHRLRKKISDSGLAIRTIRGLGYSLETPE